MVIVMKTNRQVGMKSRGEEEEEEEDEDDDGRTKSICDDIHYE